MDPNTGRIELITTDEDRLDAQKRGLIPLTEEEAAKLSEMTRKQRIDWAAERQALASTHPARSGKTRNQRKAERRNRGKRRGR